MSSYSQNLIKWQNNEAPKATYIFNHSQHKIKINSKGQFSVPVCYPGITNVNFTGRIYSIALIIGGIILDKWYNYIDPVDKVYPFYLLSDNRTMPNFMVKNISFEIVTIGSSEIVIEYDDVTYKASPTKHIFPIIQNINTIFNLQENKSIPIHLFMVTLSLQLKTEGPIYGAELQFNNTKLPFCQINKYEWIINFDLNPNLQSKNLINFNYIDDINIYIAANKIQNPIMILQQKVINFACYDQMNVDILYSC